MAGLSAMAGLGVTLELLPAPTKAVVAAALAGVAADICIASRAPAQCLSYRVPYDEDVFQVRGLLSAAQRPGLEVSTGSTSPRFTHTAAFGLQGGSEAVRAVGRGLARAGKPMVSAASQRTAC